MLYFNIYSLERKNIDFCSSFLKSHRFCFVTSLPSAVDCWKHSFSLLQYRNKKVLQLWVIDKPSHVRVTAEQHSFSLYINSGHSVTPCHSPCGLFLSSEFCVWKKCGHPEGCNQTLVGTYWSWRKKVLHRLKFIQNQRECSLQ